MVALKGLEEDNGTSVSKLILTPPQSISHEECHFSFSPPKISMVKMWY